MTKTMLLTTTGLLTGLLTTSGIARAQGTRPTETRPEPARTAEQAPPKPAPELEETRWMLGTWKCDGKAPAGAMGPSTPAFEYKSKITFKKEANNFAMAVEYEQAKSKANPMGYQAKGLVTYDSTQQKFVMMGVDSTGGWFSETGAKQGDTLVSEGDATMNGQKMRIRETFTRAGDRSMTWKGEIMASGSKDWQVIGEDSCKK